MQIKAHKGKVLAASLLILFVSVTLAYAWISAPADPKYKGVRLSTLLYRTYGGAPGPGFFSNQGQPASQDCRDALKQLGPKAAPLLTSWIENRPSPVRDKLRDFLRKKKVNWPYLTANHQDIVERLFFQVPAAAVPLADAFRWQILHGQPRDATRAASLLMFVMNSVDAPARELIAARGGDFAVALLDKFEAEKQDVYALCLVGAVLKNHPDHLTPELRERILTLSQKSRYLESAAAALKAAPPPERAPAGAGRR